MSDPESEECSLSISSLYRPKSLSLTDSLSSQRSVSEADYGTPTSSFNSSIRAATDRQDSRCTNTDKKGSRVNIISSPVNPKTSKLLWELVEMPGSANYEGFVICSNDGYECPYKCTVFSPLTGSPSDRPLLIGISEELTSLSREDLIPPLIQQIFGRSFSIDKDGPNNKGIWSIGLSPDGKLILYNNGKKVENVTEVAGIQLNKVEENGKMVEKFTYACASDQDAQHYFHCNKVMELRKGGVNMSPVDPETLESDDYDPGATLCPKVVNEQEKLYFFQSEAAAYLALDWTDPEHPCIKAVPEPKLIGKLEELQKSGKDFHSAQFSALVNIRFVTGGPSKIALFFEGDQYRYYIHVKDTELQPHLVRRDQLSDHDWKDHLQFTDEYDYHGGDCPDGSPVTKDEPTACTTNSSSPDSADSVLSGHTSGDEKEKGPSLIPYEDDLKQCVPSSLQVEGNHEESPELKPLTTKSRADSGVGLGLDSST